jgi:hypothetical protein
MAERITLVLGAGASRAVSYASKRPIRSPLDSDLFELLQKVEAKDRDETAVSELIQWTLAAHSPVWNSMERTFYTLHLRAQMQEVLFPAEHLEASVKRLLSCFTRAVDTLLRKAQRPPAVSRATVSAAPLAVDCRRDKSDRPTDSWRRASRHPFCGEDPEKAFGKEFPSSWFKSPF